VTVIATGLGGARGRRSLAGIGAPAPSRRGEAGDELEPPSFLRDSG
jgi:hypothetical protein